jgi:hypothetical protein
MCLTGCTPSDRPGSGADPAGTCTGSVSECPTVCPENPVIEFIRQNNAIFPSAGDDACHMVSKFVTDVNLPGSATFTGPPGAPPDPDTFRVQIRGLLAGRGPRVRVQVSRSGTSVYSQEFGTVEAAALGCPAVYRTDKHLRLVSNAPPAPKPAGSTYDDEISGIQTILVKLGDTITATMIAGGPNITASLQVARPPAEAGAKAIRTADIHFVTLRGVGSAPATIVDRMSEDWAQTAIRYNLATNETVDAVKNVLSVSGTAASDGLLRVNITPQGGSAHRIQIQVHNGDTQEQISARLSAAISATAGLAATDHTHDTQRLIMVNKGHSVTFASMRNTVTGVVFTEPVLDYTDDISLLEGSVLGLNFQDADRKVITMIAVTDITILGGSDAATGGDYLQANLPGWHNVSFLREPVVDADDSTYPTGAGHEMGHALFNTGNPGHHATSTNVFYAFENRVAPETLASRKRLTDAQNTLARSNSAASANPILQQR